MEVMFDFFSPCIWYVLLNFFFIVNTGDLGGEIMNNFCKLLYSYFRNIINEISINKGEFDLKSA